MVTRFLITCITLYVLYVPSFVFSRKSTSRKGGGEATSTSSLSVSILDGTKVVTKDGVEYVYQVPTANSPPKGVIFLAHGCSHSATDWWPASDKCPDCIGLPVERSIVSVALSRNLIPVALSSSNRENKCWSPEDLPIAQKVIETLLLMVDKNTNSRPPLFLLGASSGGSFIGRLLETEWAQSRVTSAICQIMGFRSYHIDTPTMFMLMERDEQTLRVVKARIAHHSQHWITVVPSLGISPSFFYDHGVMSLEDSKTLQEHLFSLGRIHPLPTYKLMEDPRASDWRSVVRTALPSLQDSLQADRSPIAELMNMAWAMHEITNYHIDDMFDWLETHHKPSAKEV